MDLFSKIRIHIFNPNGYMAFGAQHKNHIFAPKTHQGPWTFRAWMALFVTVTSFGWALTGAFEGSAAAGRRKTSSQSTQLSGLASRQPSEQTSRGLCQPGWRVCFSPSERCTPLIVAMIDKAQERVWVQAYSFTSDPIAEALVRARKRGCDVQVLLDHSHENAPPSSAISLLLQGQVPILIDAPPGIAHNKVMVCDSRFVITGSFNWTRAADSRNAENVLVLEDTDLASAYENNWRSRRAASHPFEAIAAEPNPPASAPRMSDSWEDQFQAWGKAIDAWFFGSP